MQCRNMLRVMRAVEEVSRQLKEATDESEDWMEIVNTCRTDGGADFDSELVE